MTSQGSPWARYRRALATGNPLLAWAAAHELPRLELDDALGLVLLLGATGDANFQRASARWVAHYAQQTHCDALEADLLRASLAAVAGTRAARPAAGQTLRELLELHRLAGCLRALDRHAVRGQS